MTRNDINRNGMTTNDMPRADAGQPEALGKAVSAHASMGAGMNPAMTGQQENPGTGRKLDHTPTNAVSIERVAEAIGIQNVRVFNPVREGAQIKEFIAEKMKTNELTLVVLRQTCILAAAQLAKRKA